MKKIDLVQQECRRLQDLLDNFLHFAKAHRLNLQPSDLNAQVRRVLDFYRPKARQAGVDVVDYLTADLPTVLLDREAFQGALLNLVLNAEQAMPQGGQLVVRSYGTPDGVALELIDTGCGMDDAVRDKVFEAFFSTKRGGSGLGLPNDAEDHRRPRRTDRLAQRARPRHPGHGQPARAPPLACWKSDWGLVQLGRLCFSITVLLAEVRYAEA